MTRYDSPPASDGAGGRHPLAGVPQVVLDAATQVLRNAVDSQRVTMDLDDVQPIAHAVLAEALTAFRRFANHLD